MGPTRNKLAFTMAALLIAGTLIGYAHNRALDHGRPFVIREAVRLILSPVNSGCHRVLALGEWIVRVARPRSMVLRENAALRREVKRLTQENAALADAAEENLQLKQALALKRNLPLKTISAQIIGRQASSWFDTATIDRGRRHGVRKGAAVVDFRGLVGQVVDTDAFTSQIVALTDDDSRVGAMVRRSRCSGILYGQGQDYLVLTYLPKDADVKEDDIVVSSGIGRVIPKGFVIGRVVKVVRSSVAQNTTVIVRPSVRWDRVEYVSVVTTGAATDPSVEAAP